MKVKEKVLKFKKPGALELISIFGPILPVVRHYKTLYYICKYAKYARK